VVASSKKRTHPFDLEQMLTYKVSLLYSRLALATSRQLAQGFDLVLREWRVLALLARAESMSATTLVSRSPMDKASVSRAVTNLVDRGLISARPDPADARVRNLALTRAGRRVFERIAPLARERQRALLDALTPAERKTVFRALDKLIARANEFLDDAEPAEPSKHP
jgi:DNA-binding MarR family transcriptional regulator